MKLRIQEGLAFISGSLTYQGKQLELENVIVDTGSTGSVFSIDKLSAVGFVAQPRMKYVKCMASAGLSMSYCEQRIDCVLMNWRWRILKSKSGRWIITLRRMELWV